jgi:predicted permease
MTPRHDRWMPALVRGLVRLTLYAHPRAFRARFGDAVLTAVEDDLTDAARNGRTARRVAAGAVVDAVASLRAARAQGTCRCDHPQESPTMRNWLRDAVDDIRFGLRGFRRELNFTAAVILSLALGVGVNAAMFGVADRLLLSGPAHVRDADRVQRVQMTTQPPGMDTRHDGFFAYAAYLAIARQTAAFERVAAYSEYPDGVVFGRGTDARRLNTGQATASLFPLLGVTPALGRFYTEAEDDPVSPQPVVVIGYALWQREYNGRAEVLGQSIMLDDAPYDIVGVAPSGFTGPDLIPVDVWFPESWMGRQVVKPNWTTSWNAFWLSIVVRLKPDVAVAQADRDVTSAFRGAYHGSNRNLATATLALRPVTMARDGTESMESRVSTWLGAVAGIVLLVVCANVVNLMLARGIRRRREIAVRLALGASRARLVRLLVAESLTLALAGGTAALLVAYTLGTLVRHWLMPTIEWPEGPVNVRILTVCAAISLLAGVLVGLVPAWRASAPGGTESLKAGVREGGGRTSHTRTILTVTQAALCALLLVGSGLFVVSLQRVRGIDLGLDPSHVLMFGIQRSGIPATDDAAARDRERARRAAFYPMVLERLKQRPDVEAAGLTIGLAFWNGFGEDIQVPGLATIPTLKGGGPWLSAVTADYFTTVGTRIVRGRAFTSADRAGTAPVAIVNQTMAATLWPSRDAIGQCFVINKAPACTEVVGIAANTRHFKLQEDESLSFYVPFGQETGIGGTTLIVRPRGDGGAILATVRRDLMALDPTITFVSADWLQDRVEPLVRPWELGATMFSLMGVLALVVATIGLYSVMAYFVTYRTHEIGVRMALGARPADVASLVIRGGLALAGGGIVVGLALALLAAHLVEPLLFRTSPRDPAVYATVAVVLGLMAVAATVVPAARARRVNPVEAMREE